ncbi:LysR family transcriptional regulator [Sphingomonas sp. BK580]|uniref:LysR family transcriptional regulator n=1 Tax=Sphingomonas sp. BK580 TaxID=2586972 RepID=UPI001618F852|nr:LysR family transcriptional regulator [Sphingomonas sp. BK580]MBB3695240.1 DNA-binding transcriptional LysR family regulator [Sphingomonas sp. BK580]
MFDTRVTNGITVFVAAAETGSFLKAASLVGLSRSGVGKSIARLEERLGFKLFDRTRRAVKLTVGGRRFLEQVRPLLEKLGEAASGSSDGSVRGRIRVCADAPLALHFLIPALPRLIKRHPKLKVDVFVKDRLENMLAEGFDVAVRFGEVAAKGLDQTDLFESRLLTCASPAYLEHHGEPADPAELSSAKHTCIRLMDPTTGRPHDWTVRNDAGETMMLEPDCNITVNDLPSMRSAIVAGVGVGHVIEIMGESDFAAGRLVEVCREWNSSTLPARIFTPQGSSHSLELRVFVDFVADLAVEREMRGKRRSDPPSPAITSSEKVERNAA